MNYKPRLCILTSITASKGGAFNRRDKMDKYDDSIELTPVKQDKEASDKKQKPKVMMDKTAYDGPEHENPLDNVRSDLHSK